MKRKVKVILNGKVSEGEVTVRDLDHFNIQLNNPSKVFKDKTKYTRKQKHKNKNFLMY